MLEGDAVVIRIRREEIRSLRIEQRPSFRHPVLGLAVGIALLAPAAVLVGPEVLSDTELVSPALTKSLGKLAIAIAVVMSALGGAYLLYGALTRREIPFLVVGTTRGENAYALAGPISAKLAAALDELAPPTSTKAVRGPRSTPV